MRNITSLTVSIIGATALIAGGYAPALARASGASTHPVTKTALWKVTSAQRTLYITGAVMASLKKYPIPAALTDAFGKSGSVIMEGTPVHTKAELKKLKAFIMQHGVQANGHTLGDELTASQLALVKKASTASGVPFVAVQHFQPWWAAAMLNAKRVVKSGIKPHQLYLVQYPNLVGPVNLLSSLRKAGYHVSQL